MPARKVVAPPPRKRERAHGFLELLASEEEEILEMLASMIKGKSDDIESIPALQLALAAHAAVKEQVLYPALRAALRDPASTLLLSTISLRWIPIDALLDAALRDRRDLPAIAGLLQENLQSLFEQEREALRAAKKLEIESLERAATAARQDVRVAFADSPIRR